jgi:hypothetical protein
MIGVIDLSRHPICTAECLLSELKRTSVFAAQMSGFDPKRTFRLFRRDPPRYIVTGSDLAPNDVDVTAQVIHLVRVKRT